MHFLILENFYEEQRFEGRVFESLSVHLWSMELATDMTPSPVHSIGSLERERDGVPSPPTPSKS